MCHFPETGDNSSLEGDNLFLKDMTLCNRLVPSSFPEPECPSCEWEVCVQEGISVSDAISWEQDRGSGRSCWGWGAQGLCDPSCPPPRSEKVWDKRTPTLARVFLPWEQQRGWGWPPGAMMPWRQVELPAALKILVVLRGHLPGTTSAKQQRTPGTWGETVSRNDQGQILCPDTELCSITQE